MMEIYHLGKVLTINSKNEVSYLLSNNSTNLTQVHPIAALTVDTNGEDLTEMIDLHHAGAVAFSDGDNPVWQTDILLKSLLYLQKFEGLLVNKPEDKWLNMYGSMNEGINSTMLGMKGMPGLAEELIISRDVDLLNYTGGKIHFSNISSAKSVDLIRKVKGMGLNVTCDIAAHQVIFEDSHVSDFDTNFKVNPPFREKKDNLAIIKGLKDGTIDVVVSSHCPQDEESKKLEFDLAKFGIIGLQTVFPCLVEISKDINLEDLLDKITSRPREILSLPVPKIKEGENANLTLYDPKKSWLYDEKSNKSKSVNSPFLGSTLLGKAMGVLNNGLYYFDPELSL